ncbi:hypothetical protein V8E51_017636 [Hyaloscypha variabilis]
MPSLSKIILLSSLLLSGALSLPFASEDVELTARNNGWHYNSNSADPITRGSKRDTEKVELEARNNGWHYNSNSATGLTRGSKREAEAEPEARNTLETIPVAQADFAKRSPGGAHAGFGGHHKREAEDAELEARNNGWHYNSNSADPITRGSKREEVEEPVEAVTETADESVDEEVEKRNNGWHYNSNSATGLTRGSKREEVTEPSEVTEEDVEKRNNGWHYNSNSATGLTRGS